jgi:hypothetical protein
MDKSPWMLHELGKYKIEQALAECEQRTEVGAARRQIKRARRLEPSAVAAAVAALVLFREAARTLLSARRKPTRI